MSKDLKHDAKRLNEIFDGTGIKFRVDKDQVVAKLTPAEHQALSKIQNAGLLFPDDAAQGTVHST